MEDITRIEHLKAPHLVYCIRDSKGLQYFVKHALSKDNDYTGLLDWNKIREMEQNERSYLLNKYLDKNIFYDDLERDKLHDKIEFFTLIYRAQFLKKAFVSRINIYKAVRKDHVLGLVAGKHIKNFSWDKPKDVINELAGFMENKTSYLFYTAFNRNK